MKHLQSFLFYKCFGKGWRVDLANVSLIAKVIFSRNLSKSSLYHNKGEVLFFANIFLTVLLNRLHHLMLHTLNTSSLIYHFEIVYMFGSHLPYSAVNTLISRFNTWGILLLGSLLFSTPLGYFAAWCLAPISLENKSGIVLSIGICPDRR